MRHLKHFITFTAVVLLALFIYFLIATFLYEAQDIRKEIKKLPKAEYNDWRENPVYNNLPDVEIK